MVTALCNRPSRAPRPRVARARRAVAHPPDRVPRLRLGSAAHRPGALRPASPRAQGIAPVEFSRAAVCRRCPSRQRRLVRDASSRVDARSRMGACPPRLEGLPRATLAGPHLQPSVAWVRARREAALMMMGGRNLDGSASTQLSLSNGNQVIDSWTIAPGFFFRLIPLPAGAIDGQGYVAVAIRASSDGNRVRVSLEQFDVQADGVAMMGFAEGWQEPEYNPTTSRSWRWMSERAVLWVRPTGRDVHADPQRRVSASLLRRRTCGPREHRRTGDRALFPGQRLHRARASSRRTVGGPRWPGRGRSRQMVRPR